MTYVSRPMGSRLGIHADKVEAKRQELGLTRSGFRQDGTDALKAEKEAMQLEMYRRADAHLPPGLVVAPASESETEGEQEHKEE